MTITEKIEVYKPMVDWDLSTFVKETLVYPYDFKKATEYALRRINKIARATMIDFFIPLIDLQRYYHIPDTTLFTKRKVELVSLTGVSFWASGVDENITPTTSTSLTGWQYVNLSNAENIYRDNMFDYQALAQFITGKDFGFKLSVTSTQRELGVFDTITAVNDDTITVGTSAAVGKIISNLDKATQNEYYQATVVTAGVSPVLDVDVEASPYNWEVGDKVYVSEGKPTFLVMTFKVMPKYGYFDSETEIPIIPSLLDSLDSFAIGYLYTILIGRDPTQMSINKFNALKATQRIKTETEELAYVKMLTADAKPTVIKSYLPYCNTPTTYGR